MSAQNTTKTTTVCHHSSSTVQYADVTERCCTYSGPVRGSSTSLQIASCSTYQHVAGGKHGIYIYRCSLHLCNNTLSPSLDLFVCSLNGKQDVVSSRDDEVSYRSDLKFP